MKNRGMALAVALLVAAGATAAIFLYVQSVKKHATQPSATVTVIVSKNDITAGTKLDSLITGGQFTTLSVPTDAVVPGAVTSEAQFVLPILSFAARRRARSSSRASRSPRPACREARTTPAGSSARRRGTRA